MGLVEYLNPGGKKESSTDFEMTDWGVIIPAANAFEVLIPWGRVLAVWDDRGKLPRRNGS